MLNYYYYLSRLFIHDHIGLETDNETILLAYQISKSIHSGEYPLQSPDKAVSLAAMMTQIEHGDWNSQLVEQDGETLDQIMGKCSITREVQREGFASVLEVGCDSCANTCLIESSPKIAGSTEI